MCYSKLEVIRKIRGRKKNSETFSSHKSQTFGKLKISWNNPIYAHLLLGFKGPNSKDIDFKQFYMLKSLNKMGFQDLVSSKIYKQKKKK